jgi:hypothetical protein
MGEAEGLRMEVVDDGAEGGSVVRSMVQVDEGGDGMVETSLRAALRCVGRLDAGTRARKVGSCRLLTDVDMIQRRERERECVHRVSRSTTSSAVDVSE